MTESETGGPELYFPALGGVYEKLTPYIWPLVRMTVGLLLALGPFTRLIALLVVGFMAVSAYYVHAANGFLWIKGGFEYPLFWGLVALAIAVRGSGPMSLDARMKHQF